MTISLVKGGNISLEKVAPGLTNIALGLGWDQKEKKGFFGKRMVNVDLDASCLLFDENKKLLDSIWFRQLKSRDGSVVHTGDDLTGGGTKGTPNEEIKVDLANLSQNVKTLIFTVNSFSSDTFDGIPNAFCILKNLNNNEEVARYNLSIEGGGYTGLVIAKLYKHNGEWKFKALDGWGKGRTFDKLSPVIAPCL
ncbi:MAG: TerD family protein [Desulfobacteraceae bacterium]|nr:TerD family protein [Desulfobacteraceae bacterium]